MHHIAGRLVHEIQSLFLTTLPNSRYQRATMMPMFKRTKTTKTPEAAALERARES
jgi:hypothetical protein